MKAAVRDRYGSSEVELREVDKPVPTEDEVLVRVRAASLNMADWYGVMGRPYVGRTQMGLRKPKTNRLGVDYAGVVEAVGENVTEFRPGDEVFGGRDGAYAEYVCPREDRAIVPKPANVTFEEAAAAPVAALTALQGLRDKGQLQPGQKVLVNGASGGVGTFAIQIAKALGAEVTAVCSTSNVDIARSLGADHVIDYIQEDFTLGDQRYDLLLDVAGSRSWSECKRVLTPQATLVIVGGPKSNRLLGPLGHLVKVRLAGVRSSRKVVFFIAKFNKADMLVLRELLESGKMTSVIDRRYDLSEIADAFRYLGEGHARGKVVITV
ncbi:MAG: NAD(P)-dependent alcohol dehydrogenase [Actinomycetota bacterium]|nr:NAD(P)-dependent alcohol dehydrogenase [Actinomycetota bacterium]